MSRPGYNQKKQNIVQVAERLFAETGYENTSVDTIIARAKISKGTFYHYFKSKRDILEAIVTDLRESLLKEVRTIVHETGRTALEKLNSYFALNRGLKTTNPAMGMLRKSLYLPENLVLRHKLSTELVRVLSPLIAVIIRQGLKEKSFQVDAPQETARLMIHLGINLRDELVEGLAEQTLGKVEVVSKIQAFQQAMERILEAPANSLVLVDDDYLKMINASSKQENTEAQ